MAVLSARTALIGWVLLSLVEFEPVCAQPPLPPAQNPTAASRVSVAPGWGVFRGRDGLVLFHPIGWQVQERAAGGFIAFRPGAGGNATALVFAQPIEKIEGQAQGVAQEVGRIFPELFPGARASRVRPISGNPEVAVAAIAYTAGGQPFKGASMCFKLADRGVVYVMASNPATWIQDGPVMETILKSFFYSAPGPANAAALPAMVPWRDPHEGAFTCPVPQGWNVEGGLQRFSAIDFRPELLATRPDRKVLVRLGDAAIPPLSLPGPMLLGAGFPEGSWYSPDGVTRRLVLRYLPGARFLTDYYLPQRVGGLGNVQIKEMPELSRQEQAKGARMGIASGVDTAEVYFDAQTENGLRKGYGFIQTVCMPIPGSQGEGLWFVSRIFGYLADPPLEPLAGAVLNRMAAGYQTDAAWEAMQLRTAAKVSKIWSDTRRDISDMITSTFQERAKSQDRMHDKWTKAFRGEVVVEDPNTHQRYTVPSGSNYYWRIGAGAEFIGTQTSDPVQLPNHWVQQMRIVD
ncbi:MAG: hypothetical protein MUD16_09710 [Desulfobacterales bacterium]|jgi:hypothetical protein|nr:hypothetical protein [Desulfobacterales bacterium]